MKKIILFISINLAFLSIFAQADLTINAMQSIPQSNYNNPAFIPDCETHIGIPFLSSLYFNIGNTGFNTKDLITIDKNDSVKINMKNLINKMAEHNYIYTDFNEELLSFGFKFKEKHYFNFALTEKLNFKISYPKDLFRFAYDGNGAHFNEEMMIGKFTINATHYREFALGYSMIFNDKLTFGARAKLLFGKANINTRKNDISLTTEDEFYNITAKTNIDINTCLPEGLLNDNSTDISFKDYFLSSQNIGFGIDLGATYKHDDKLSFGLSVTDLGFIKWKNENNIRNYYSSNINASYTFRGIDPTSYFEHDTMLLDNLKDSVFESLKIDSSTNSYTSTLNAKINMSAFYDITKNDRFSALVRLHFFNNSVHPAINLAYQRKLANILRISASYSIAYRNFTNLGVGLSANLGPFQLYFVSDNILSPIIFNKYTWMVKNDDGNFSEKSVTMPRNWKYMNFHFGINLVFGYKTKKVSTPVI